MIFTKHYMLKILIIYILIGSTQYLLSNEKIDKSNTNISSVYFEFAGQGSFVSINYDKCLYNNTISLRCGIGVIAIPGSRGLGASYTFPIGINYLKGNKNIFESGIGFTQFFSMNSNFGLYPNVWIGYRYQKSSDLFFKVGIAIYAKDINHYVGVPGASLGASF